VFDGWEAAFPELEVDAVDLHAGLNVAEAASANYEAAVAAAASLLPRPLALVGWSMGGLAALQAARRVDPEALVLLEPSPPAEVQGFDRSVEPAPGLYEGEAAYGPFPPGIGSRPESALARAERKRGVPAAAPTCPTLVVFGDELAEERGHAVARAYGAEELHLPGLDHWGLVLDGGAPAAVAGWLSRVSGL